MFKQAVMHYPTDEKALAQINKEIASFRCTAALRYIQSLNLSEKQIQMLYASLAGDIAAREQKAELPNANMEVRY